MLYIFFLMWYIITIGNRARPCKISALKPIYPKQAHPARARLGGGKEVDAVNAAREKL